MPDWERDREKVEFERASMLFKPLNFTMSSKFVSAGTSEEADKGDEKKEKVLTESEKAVKMKLFGNLTRYGLLIVFDRELVSRSYIFICPTFLLYHIFPTLNFHSIIICTIPFFSKKQQT